MKIEDMIRGESKNIEFKEILPSNSEKYTKTIVAFANTQGGKLIIGVADQTRKIVGVDEATLFQTMDSISNAISDSCEPQLVPNIEPYTIGRKTVIIVSVAPGPHRPYYLKAKGKEKGVFIRAAGTTRPASYNVSFWPPSPYSWATHTANLWSLLYTKSNRLPPSSSPMSTGS